MILVSQKMNISIEEAGKIFDVDKEELTSLKFNAFMMDTIKQTAADVVKNYAEKEPGTNSNAPKRMIPIHIKLKRS